MSVTLDVYSAAWGALGATVIYLLGWVGKHLLDRLVLAPFLDWWARRTKRSALRKAERLANSFERSFRYTNDARLLVLEARVRQVLFYMMQLLHIMFALLVMLTTIGAKEPFGLTPPLLAFGGVLFVALPAGLIFIREAYDLTRYDSMVNDLEATRKKLMLRLLGLLQAAGLNEIESAEWMQRVLVVGRP